ncbi:MAG: sulfurtransferase [Alphaproteobacteria bacterium]|nr:sulfurtransferase [Alphaproteobacteria bacterium]
MSANFKHPDQLITADELEPQLGSAGLRVYDCTTHLLYETGTGKPYTVKSGAEDYATGHIPLSAFLDLQGQLSVADSPFRFTVPEPNDLASRFARLGIGDGDRVVLYARGNMQWATRIWWMLRYVGFDNAAILDGGWEKWQHDGRPVATETTVFPATTLTPKPRPELFVGRDEMLAAIDDGATCILNALGPELHRGELSRYGRPGRIPGSVNVPAASLQEPDTKEFVSLDRIVAAFEQVGLRKDQRILNYCGGGIAATLDAYLLHQLGYRDLAVYDNSMSEWATDESLPIEKG